MHAGVDLQPHVQWLRRRATLDHTQLLLVVDHDPPALARGAIEFPGAEHALENQQPRLHAGGAKRGGLVTEAPTYELLRSACYTVWIRASPEEHMQRVIAQGDLRPMTGREEAMADLRRILAERNDLYGLADVVIDTSNKTVDASQEELQNMYNIST